MFLTGIFSLISSAIFMTGMLEKKNSFPKPLPKDKEKELLDKMWDGDNDAKDTLIKHNMRLVVHIAKKYNNYYDSDELISVGSLGLIKAVNTYKKGKGTGLATYAARCIDNEILMTIRASKKYKNDRSLFEPVSSDKEGNEITLIDLMSRDNDNVIKQVEDEVVKEKLLEIVKKVLTLREFDIIKYRYGLEDEEVLTQREIAKKHCISRSYISRIEKKALEKIRKRIIEEELYF